MMKFLSFSFLTLLLMNLAMASSKVVEIRVEDKHGMAIPNAPVYVQQFEEGRRLTSRGGLPYFEKYAKPVIEKMWKTNARGVVSVGIEDSRMWKNPTIQITIGIVAYSRGGGIWSHFEIGHSESRGGGFVIPELHGMKVTPRNIPDELIAKTYFADVEEVKANILEALEKARRYDVIPGYKE